MPHLILPLTNLSYSDAFDQLQSAHEHLVACSQQAYTKAIQEKPRWGIQIKRLSVDLDENNSPRLIGKSSEKFTEVINIAATTERLISVIKWFSTQPQFKNMTIQECHPSTSDEATANDIVLSTNEGDIAVRCEVCDVVSSNAGSNGKEKKDLCNLGCSKSVPEDGVDRFICTAPEFAKALSNPGKHWEDLHYRYRLISLGDAANTSLLQILPPTKDVLHAYPVGAPTYYP